jgi:alpha-beta hydrolase superfamily lysophospholipase
VRAELASKLTDHLVIRRRPAPAKRNVLIKDATHFVLFEKNRMQFFDEVLKFMKE